MRVQLEAIAVFCAVAAAVVLGAASAAAAQQAALEGVTVSWDGQGEIQLTPGDQGELSLIIRLDGKVVVRGKQFDATAERLIYSTAAKVVTLESGDKGEVRLSFQTLEKGPTMRLTARKIAISLSDGRIKVDGAGVLTAPDKKQAL